MMVKKCIDCDTSEPGIERRVRPEAIERLIRLQPNFLRKIFGVLGVAAIVKREQIYPSGVAFGELAERFSILRLGATDQIRFVVVFCFAVSQAAEPRGHAVDCFESLNPRSLDSCI